MQKGEIWIAHLKSKEGREQQGTRPCILLTSTEVSLITIIPLTSNRNALRFPNTLKIEKDNINNLKNDSIALIFQIQSIDKKRIKDKVGKLKMEKQIELNSKIKSYLNLI